MSVCVCVCVCVCKLSNAVWMAVTSRQEPECKHAV